MKNDSINDKSIILLLSKKFTSCYFHGFEVRSVYILNVGITWISSGVAPGYINISPLGLFCSYTWLFFSKKVYNKFGCCYFHGFEVRSVYILNVGITWIS
jgi:hypothetical protein